MRRRRRDALPLLAALLPACSAAPPPTPTVRLDTAPALPPAQPPLPARWVESNGCTSIGPSLPAGPGGRAPGTLVLLGGRRALVHEDGTIEGETAPAPEPICGLLEVPSAEHGGRTVLVGRALMGLYRLDDPLGEPVPLTHTTEVIMRVGAWPSAVAVWTGRSDLPRFVDVATGQERSVPRLPEPPMRALLFADEKRGAAVFEAVGLAITADGGATWRLAAESAPYDALRAAGLRRRAGALRAFGDADGPDAAVDLDAARVGAFEPPRPSAAEPPLLRWIRATGQDPLEAAASAGLDLAAGGALVASHGLLARVDPASGAIRELVEIAHNAGAGACGAGRAAQGAWVACAVGQDTDPRLFDPFGVMRVSLGDGALAVGRPDLVRNGEAELRVAPSGGAMLLAACSNDEAGSACVRQPSGRWRTIALDLVGRGAGPLADGRVAFLRGTFDGDLPPGPIDTTGAPRPPPATPPGDIPLGRLHVAVAGPDGQEHPLALVPFTPSRGNVRVQSPIEEEADHTLRFVIEDGEGPFAVSLPPGHDTAEARRIPDAAAARLHAGRGIAIGNGHVLGSLDGGETWRELAAPPSVLDAARVASVSSFDEPEQLAVSEVGAKILHMLHLGWEPEPASTAGLPDPFRPLPQAPELAPRPPSPAAPEPVLSCASQGPVAATPPLAGLAQAKELLAGAGDRLVRAPSDAERRPGVRHETTTWWSGRAGMLDAIARLDEEGPDGKGAAPERWTLRWHDPTEIGGRVRSASLPAPADAAFGSNLRFAAASGGRALFAIRSGAKLRLVHTKPSGAADVVEVPSDLAPTGDVAFGEGKVEAIAWVREALVIVWLPGEPPRAVARLGAHAMHVVGAPTSAGVPILLGGADWTLTRTLPIPRIYPQPGTAPAPERLPLDGWTRLPAILRRLDTLSACAPRAGGARFVTAAPSLRAEIDGVAETATHGLYEVRVDGAAACVAGVTATLAPERRSAPPAAPRGGHPAPTPAAFVRADLPGKRAEGGARGLPPAPVKRMACALER